MNTIQDKFKRIEELAKSAKYERNRNAMWTDADLIMSLAKSIIREIEGKRPKKSIEELADENDLPDDWAVTHGYV